jgi:hypothetical protein
VYVTGQASSSPYGPRVLAFQREWTALSTNASAAARNCSAEVSQSGNAVSVNVLAADCSGLPAPRGVWRCVNQECVGSWAAPLGFVLRTCADR